MTRYISREVKSAIIGYYRSGATVFESSELVTLSTGTISEIISYYLENGKHE